MRINLLLWGSLSSMAIVLSSCNPADKNLPKNKEEMPNCMPLDTVDRNKDFLPNKGEWKLTWSDEFNGDELNVKSWSPLKAAYSNNEQSYYSEDNAAVSNGTLILKAEKKGNPDNKPYVSGAITSQKKFAQTYGRFEIRAKLPTGQGYWPAFWLMPEDMVVHGPWPACGEIDILETAGDVSGYVGTLHFGGRNNQHAAAGIGSVKLPNKGLNADYHVYAVEWEPMEMRWYCDDTLMGTVRKWSTYGPNGQEQQALPAPFNKDFYVILNLAVGGYFVGNKLPVEDNANGQMLIDYVRVYAKDNYAMPSPVDSTKAVKKNLKPSGINLLEQGSFESPDKQLWKADGKAHIQVHVEGGELLAHISQDVYEQHLQSIKYVPCLDIKKDATYRLSFKARSSAPCKHVRPVIDRPEAGWSKIFLYSSLEFGAEMKEYSIDFTATAADKRSRLLFYTGLMAGDKGGGKHTLYFDDIRLEELKD